MSDNMGRRSKTPFTPDRSPVARTAERVAIINTMPRHVQLAVPVHPPADANGRQRVTAQTHLAKPGINLLDAAFWARLDQSMQITRANAEVEGRQPSGAAGLFDLERLRFVGEPGKLADLSDKDMREALHNTGSGDQLKPLAPYMGRHAEVYAKQVDIITRVERGEDLNPEIDTLQKRVASF